MHRIDKIFINHKKNACKKETLHALCRAAFKAVQVNNERKYKEICSLINLIAHKPGASLAIQDMSGRTPLQLAHYYGMHDIVTILE